jgi:hypothetical protein
MDATSAPESPSARTGIANLDDVLSGGFTPHQLYLIEGTPGAGKTTLSLQFLLEGLRQGERGLYITLSETAEELRASASAHSWRLAGLELFELPVADDLRSLNSQSLMFHASAVELGETVGALFAAVEQANPARVVIDSLSSTEGRLLPKAHAMAALYSLCASHSASLRSNLRRGASRNGVGKTVLFAEGRQSGALLVAASEEAVFLIGFTRLVFYLKRAIPGLFFCVERDLHLGVACEKRPERELSIAYASAAIGPQCGVNQQAGRPFNEPWLSKILWRTRSVEEMKFA